MKPTAYLCLAGLMTLTLSGPVFAQEEAATPLPQTVISLPAPQQTGGQPLLESMAARRSKRAYDPARPLEPQTLSTLLWTAAGYSSPDKRRTAGSALNKQCVQIIAVLPEGAYRYDADTHALRLLKAGDFRARTGMQDFVGSAPLNLLFVADLSKTSITSNESRWLCLGADAGLMSQNVYLYCTSVGLSTVLRGSVDAAALGPLLGLGENERIIFAQSVGYPPAP